MVIFTFPAIQVSTTGLATLAEQQSQTTLLTNIDAGIPVALGQTTMAASMPVTIASNQTAVPISAASLPLPTGAATEATLSAQSTLVGAVTETAPASDTASSGLNGRLQRVAQRLTSLIALIPASLGQKADSASLAVTISTEGTAQLGSIIETAPASDSASSGLNGRLQRIAQRLTSLIALIPASLGQKTAANSLAVTIASDQSAVSSKIDQTTPGTTNAVSVAQLGATTVATGNGVTGAGSQRVTIASDNTAFSVNAVQSGTWTVQPGNTANTTAWLTRQTGKSVVTTIRNDYTSTSVTTGAWVQLVASTSALVTEIDIFDSSGATLELGTGAAASETRLIIITPGGNGKLNVAIPASTRVSVRAISGTASVGELDINFFGV